MTGWVDHGVPVGRRSATVSTKELHASIAHGVARAIRDGVPVTLLDGYAAWQSDFGHLLLQDQRGDQLAALRRKVDETQGFARRARQNANTTDDAETRVGFLEDAAEYTAMARALRRQIANLEHEAAQAAEQQVPEVFTSEADYVARALGRLARCDETAPADVHAALAEILHDVRLWPDGDRVRWRLRVRVPAQGQVAELGPIEGHVRNRLRKSQAAVATADSELLQRMTRNVGTPAGRGPHAAQVRQQVIHVLQTEAGLGRLPAEVLAQCSLPEVIHAVWAELSGHDQPTLDADLVTHLLHTYLDPQFSWGKGYWAQSARWRQAIVDVVMQHGGTATVGEVCAALVPAGFKADLIRHYTRDYTTADTGAPPWLACVQRAEDWTDTRVPLALRTLHAVPCPHCGGHASVVARVPEVPSCLLCPTCRRMPLPDSPVFLPGYIAAEHNSSRAGQR